VYTATGLTTGNSISHLSDVVGVDYIITILDCAPTTLTSDI